MPHIPVRPELPGIRGLLAFKPSTGAKVADLIHELLRGDSPLAPAEREVIAAYVSGLNDCEFCARSHAAAVRHLDGSLTVTNGVDPSQHPNGADPANADPANADQTAAEQGGHGPRMPALLRLAGLVVHGGHRVGPDDIEHARAAGAGDEEIHDTVLIAAAFCMLNRYVDGLDAVTPADEAAYDTMGIQMAMHGYRRAAAGGD